MNSIQVTHFIWDLLSLGLAPNLQFITKMLSILYQITPEDVIRKEISRDEFKKLLHGGKMIDWMLDKLNEEVKQEWFVKHVQEEAKIWS